jgi:hypothetical protein
VDAGRYDVTTLISPALAAALEAAPEGGEEVVEGVMQQLNDAVERLERGQGGRCVGQGRLVDGWGGAGGAVGVVRPCSGQQQIPGDPSLGVICCGCSTAASTVRPAALHCIAPS